MGKGLRMRYIATGLSDVGQKRENNEDSFLIDNDLGLYVVCDGMGGHQGGEVASRLAVDTAARMLEESHASFADLVKTKDGRNALVQLVETAVEAACREVFARAAADPRLRGMGTTITLLLLVGDFAVMGHVGDSRLYLYRQGQVHQLSSDHTFVASLISSGTISPEDAKRHPYASVLTRSLGVQETVLVDTLLFDVLPGDTMLLCSDGLSGALESAEELGLILEEHHVQNLPQTLVDLANVRGGSDNVTVVCVRSARAPADTLLEQDFELSAENKVELKVLESSFLCQELRMDGLLRVLNLADVTALAIGERPLIRGDSSDGMLVVIRGRLRESGPRGERDLTRGHHAQATALVSPHTSEVSLEAVEPTWLIRLDGPRFRRLIQRRPTLGVRLLRNLARQLSLELLQPGEPRA